MTKIARHSNSVRPASCFARLALSLAGMLGVAAASQAGGGPENVVLVVNANSPGSKAVANHYVRLRDLPASNVVYLDYRGSKEAIVGREFREAILGPVLEAINERGLALQADVIAYSTDFPWRVAIDNEFPKELKLPPQAKPVASLTGLTYLWQQAMAKRPGLLSLDANAYLAPTPAGKPRTLNAGQCRDLGACPSRGFRSRYGWLADGSRAAKPKQGRRYLLSTMLGVTTGRGNSLEEVLRSLDRAVEAEASPPGGVVYFMQNKDIRSKTRHACFAGAVAELRKLSARAEVRSGKTPRGARDVAGLVMGAANLDLRGITIQPGALCEHLTSVGGVLYEQSYQTPLTDLIRAGAAGASGAVIEPYAIQAKFPLPSVQVHYRRGCSLAESFYQSVASPYQLLIVGDPLCQPWARRPGLKIKDWPSDLPFELDLSMLDLPGLEATPADADAPSADASEPPATDEPDDQAEKALSFLPTVTPAAGAGTAHWELFLDGRLRMRLPSGKGVSFDAAQLGPGWHELRCVGIDSDPIESQKSQRGAIEVLEADGAPIEPVRLTIESAPGGSGDRVAVSASAPGAERISIRQNSREVAAVEGEKGGALIPVELLGAGPIRLQAVAEPSGAASPPVWRLSDRP